MKKESVLDLFEGAPPQKAGPLTSEWDVEWNMDELFGGAPRGFHRRWEWYQEVTCQDLEHEQKT